MRDSGAPVADHYGDGGYVFMLLIFILLLLLRTFTAYGTSLVNCPRDHLSDDNVLNVFKAVTPTDCQFCPIKIYAIDSRKKKSTCRWKVLYVLKDSKANIHRQSQQARELKEELMRCHPNNCTIIDHEFFSDQQNNLYGWLITWRVHCHHTSNSHKIDEGLPMIIHMKK